MTRRAPGFTLVETMIYSSLLLILLGGISTVLGLGSRYYREVQALAEVQREAAAGGAALRMEIAETRGPSLTVGLAPAGLVLLSPRPDSGPWVHDSSGSLLWQRWVCFYLESRGGVSTLVRKEKKLAAPTAVPPEPVWTTALFRDSAVLPGHVVARNVTGLQVTVGSRVDVRLEVEVTSDLGRKERMVVLESVEPRQP